MVRPGGDTGGRVDHGWLRDLPEEDRRALRATAARRRFGRGSFVYLQGELGETVHLLERGHVAVRVQRQFGDEVTLDVLGPGDTFGYHALLAGDHRRTTTVVSLGAVETLALDRRRLDEVRRASPALDDFVVRLLLDQVVHLSGLLVEARSHDAESRVRRRLLQLCEQFGAGRPSVELPLTQEDLADLSGTTRPTANRVLKEAERRGAVELRRGSITVRPAELA